MPGSQHPNCAEDSVCSTDAAPWQGGGCPIVMQRPVPTCPTVAETGEMPQTQHVDKVIDVPVGLRRHVPVIYSVLQTVGVEQAQFIPQERDQQRTVEQIIDVLARPAVELPQERISECIVEQIISVPVLPSSEERERVQQRTVVTHEQVSMTHRRKKTVEPPQVQFTNNAVDMAVVMRRQMSTNKVQKMVDTPGIQFIDKGRGCSRLWCHDKLPWSKRCRRRWNLDMSSYWQSRRSSVGDT